MVELRVMVSDETAEHLSERARQEATTPEELAARVVASFVASPAPANGTGGTIIGLGSSGRTDISERAEEILRVEFGS
jgi:hypothetical protein